MIAHNIDFVKESYQERLQLTRDETIDVSLKNRLAFLKLQHATQTHIQQSQKLHRKLITEEYSISNAICFQNQLMKPKPSQHLLIYLQASLNIYGHKIIPVRHAVYRKLK